MLLKLIPPALIFYLSLELLKTSMLLTLSKELFNSLIFSRKDTLRIKNKKAKIVITGNKVTTDRFLKIKNE